MSRQHRSGADVHDEILRRAERVAEQARQAEDELGQRGAELAAVIHDTRDLDPPVPVSALGDPTGLAVVWVSQVARGRRREG